MHGAFVVQWFFGQSGGWFGDRGMVHLGKILKLNGKWVGDLEN